MILKLKLCFTIERFTKIRDEICITNMFAQNIQLKLWDEKLSVCYATFAYIR